jgi:uncharacterized membrane protein
MELMFVREWPGLTSIPVARILLTLPAAPGNRERTRGGVLMDEQLESEREQIDQNIKAVLAFYSREEEKVSASQRGLERLTLFVGKPAFMAVILLIVLAWVFANLLLQALGRPAFDPEPFPRLQGLVSLGALLIATVVLTKQNRVAKLAEQRAHLDLKVTLLIEQKTAKLIELVEELRRDLPNVKDRHDPRAATLLEPMSPERVIEALDEGKELPKPPD